MLTGPSRSSRDKEFNGTGEVCLVNPRDKLAAIALLAAEAKPDQIQQNGECIAGAPD